MILQLIQWNTILGINRLWRIEKCPSCPLLKGRLIGETLANKKQYIFWNGAKRTDFETSWFDFKEKHGITSKIEFLPIKPYKPDDSYEPEPPKSA